MRYRPGRVVIRRENLVTYHVGLDHEETHSLEYLKHAGLTGSYTTANRNDAAGRVRWLRHATTSHASDCTLRP
jgi:hypothetical protein